MLTKLSHVNMPSLGHISLRKYIYPKVYNLSRTKFQNLNDSRPVLQLSLPNLLKPCVKSRMKM